METHVSKPNVIQQENGFLVLPDMVLADPEEVTRQTDGTLACTCFTFTMLNEPCEHIETVEQWLDDFNPQQLTQADADYYLRRLAELDAMKQDNEASANLQIQRINQWIESENAILDRKRSYFLIALEGWMSDAQLKTKRLVNGTLRYRSQPLTIDILDPELVMSDERFVRVTEKRSVDKKAIRQHVTETGEELPGIRVEITPPKLSYKINPA